MVCHIYFKGFFPLLMLFAQSRKPTNSWPCWSSHVNIMLSVKSRTSLTSSFHFSLFHPFHLSLPFSSLSTLPPSPSPPFQCPGPTDHVPADDSQADVWALSRLRGGFPHQLEWRKGCSYIGSLAEEIRWGMGQNTQKRERETSSEEGKEREREKKSTLNPPQPHCKSPAGYRWTWTGPIQKLRPLLDTRSTVGVW